MEGILWLNCKIKNKQKRKKMNRKSIWDLTKPGLLLAGSINANLCVLFHSLGKPSAAKVVFNSQYL